MKAKKIRVIIDAFDRSTLNRLEITFKHGRMIMEKPLKKKETVTCNQELSSEKELIWIYSPLVGTFYIKSSHQSSPMIEISRRILKDETICIIESMKIFNEVKSPVNGTIEQIQVQDGQMVEYHQPLIAIRCDD